MDNVGIRKDGTLDLAEAKFSIFGIVPFRVFSVDVAAMISSIRTRIITGNCSIYKGFTAAESQVINEARSI